jgi:DNA-binding NarL/FixJ family response regulator
MDRSIAISALGQVRVSGRQVSDLERTHVILVNMPQMLRDIVREIVSSEQDLIIVDEFDDLEDASNTIWNDERCVVITSLRPPEQVALEDLFGVRRRMRVLAVSEDGRETVLYELRPRARNLGEISPPTLVAAIRDADPP